MLKIFFIDRLRSVDKNTLLAWRYVSVYVIDDNHPIFSSKAYCLKVSSIVFVRLFPVIDVFLVEGIHIQIFYVTLPVNLWVLTFSRYRTVIEILQNEIFAEMGNQIKTKIVTSFRPASTMDIHSISRFYFIWLLEILTEHAFTWLPQHPTFNTVFLSFCFLSDVARYPETDNGIISNWKIV